MQKWSSSFHKRPEKLMGAGTEKKGKRQGSHKHCMVEWEQKETLQMGKCSFVSYILWNNLSLCCPAFLSFPTTKHTASTLLFASSKFSLKLNSKFMQANPSQTSICSNYHGAASVLSDKEACLLQNYFITQIITQINGNHTQDEQVPHL